MQPLKLVVLGTGLLFAAPAFAEEPASAPEATPEVPPEGGGATGGMEGTVEASGGASVAMPKEVINRAHVVKKGGILVEAGLGLARATFPAVPPLIPNATTVTSEGLFLSGGYGVTDKITAGLQYAFALNEFEIKGPLTLFGNLQLVHDGKLTVTANVDFELDLCGGIDMMGDCTATKAIHAGLGARYKLGDKMAVFTGAPYGPGPIGQHLSLSLESSGPIDFDIPVGFGFQATPELFAYATTQLASIHIANKPMGASSADFIFDAYIPLALGGLFAVSEKMDVGATIDLVDLKNAGDFLFVSVVGRMHM